MANLLITGGSRGLGGAFAEGVPEAGDTVWLVSRSRPKTLDLKDGVTRHWIAADLSTTDGVDTVISQLKGETLDTIILNAGVWESTAFSDQYDFEALDRAEHHRVLMINLVGLIDLAHGMLGTLRRSDKGKLILIGSTSALSNIRDPEVAYNASKFGVLGATQGLREILRDDEIAVTCLNPGSIATEYDLSSEAPLDEVAQFGIPLIDLVNTVKYLIGLSKYSCVKQIDMPAMRDKHA